MEKDYKFPSDEEAEQFIEYQEKQRLKATWKAALNTDKTIEKKSATVRQLPLFIRYGVAASIALGLVFFTYWMVSNNTTSYQSPIAIAEAYEATFEKPHLDNLKSSKEGISLVDIKKHYQNENFPAVIATINQMSPDARPVKLLEIRAYAYLQTEQYDKTIIDLEQYIAESEQSLDDALWYLALAYLKNTPPDVPKARARLEQLKVYKTKSNQAVEMLEAIQQLEERK